MNQILFLFLIFVLGILSGKQTPAFAQTPAQIFTNPEIPNCGVQSVLNIARFVGKAPDNGQILNLNQTYSQLEISMFDVQQAAKQIGVSLEGVKATLSELEKRKQPFIAVLPNHFICVERVEGDWVRYSEAGGFIIEPLIQFAAKYQGKALVLVPQNNSGVLEVSPSIVCWNNLPFGSSEKVANIELTNTGDAPIAVKDISTSCSCTVPSQWPREILPGQVIPLQITMSLPTSGEFSQRVTIRSEDSQPIHTISLFGRVETDVSLNPAQVSFSDVVTGSSIIKTLILRDIDHKLPRPLKVATTADNLTATLTPQGEDVWEIGVTLAASQLGDIDAGLLISGPDKESRVVRVPIKARVVPMTRARPEQVIFGSVSAEGATRRLQIFRQDRQPFEVTGIEAPPYLRAELEAANTRHTEWTARVSIDPSKAPAQVSDKIAVKTRHDGKDETIYISVLALNESNVAPALPGIAEATLLPRAEDDHQTPIGSPLPPFKVGDVAPDFRAVDANGNPWRLSAMRGQKNVLLTFFPKCFTGGCANHLSSLRDHQGDFDQAQTQILAVSVDSAQGDKGQIAFAKEWGFTFPLIPDTSRALGKQFGAIQNDDELAARMSVLIDKQGIVRYVDTDVRVQSHGADILAKINELGLSK